MTVGVMFGKFWNPLGGVFKMIAGLFSIIDQAAIRLLSPIRGLITGFGSASGIVGRFASAFGSVGRVVGILGAAGKAIPFIGWIITGLQAIWGLWTRLSSGMNIFEALGETLYDVLVSPFELIVELLTKIPVIGDKFKPLLTIFPIIKSAFSSVFSTLRNGWESLKELFSGKDIVKNLINIGKAVLTGMYLVPSLIFNTIVGIFPDIFDTILSGVKSFGSILYTVFIQPWVDAWNFISDLFVGKSNSTLGDGIIKGLIGVGSAILKIFVSPFEAIFDLIIKGFTSIGSLIQTVFSAPFKIIGKLVGVDTGGIGEGAGEVGPSSDVIDAIERTNQKLDTLISLMMNGGIAVNLDGRKVSEQLAIASS
jgi:NADH:ubiquinone oxidoreductase subunit 6 (subunit J)